MNFISFIFGDRNLAMTPTSLVSTGGRSFLLLSDYLIQPRGQIHKY